MEVKLFFEDHYGWDFLKHVIDYLGMAKKVENTVVKKPRIHLPILCNKKLDRMLSLNDRSCDKILIVADADGPENYNKRIDNVKKHIPIDMRTPVEIVLFEYEAEEWICISLGIKWHSKPSSILKREIGYKKNLLPKYADRLDYDKLFSSSRSFRSFIDALK